MSPVNGIWDEDENKVDDSVFARTRKGDRKFSVLNPELEEKVRYVLEQILPREHLRGQTQLKAIVRDKKWFRYATLYNPRDLRIEIRVPFKMTSKFLGMTKAEADSTYVSMVKKKKSRVASYWATSPEQRDKTLQDNFFEWMICHEFGHSIDRLIQFTNRHSGKPIFGGWVYYQNEEYLLRDIFFDVTGKSPRNYKHRQWEQIKASAPFRALKDAISVPVDDPWRPGRRWAEKKEWEKKSKEFWTGSKFKNHRDLDDISMKVLEQVYRILDCGIDDPWLEPRLKAHEIRGRRYHFMSDYKKWYSYSASAYRHRISNYQFSSPSEWFAEIYCAYFGKDNQFQRLLKNKPGTKDICFWFFVHLDPEGYKRRGYFERKRPRGVSALREASAEDPAHILERSVPMCWYFDNIYNEHSVPYEKWRRRG